MCSVHGHAAVGARLADAGTAVMSVREAALGKRKARSKLFVGQPAAKSESRSVRLRRQQQGQRGNIARRSPAGRLSGLYRFRFCSNLPHQATVDSAWLRARAASSVHRSSRRPIQAGLISCRPALLPNSDFRIPSPDHEYPTPCRRRRSQRRRGSAQGQRGTHPSVRASRRSPRGPPRPACTAAAAKRGATA